MIAGGAQALADRLCDRPRRVIQVDGLFIISLRRLAGAWPAEGLALAEPHMAG